MTTAPDGVRRPRRRTHQVAVALATASVAATLAGPGADAKAAATPTLPLGDDNLIETRTTETLAQGVTLTRIQRGADPTAVDDIATTTRGPWRVTVLTIDRDTAGGHLRATYGPDLSRTEPTTGLVASSGALAGVNASFFAIGTPHPGDPVGLGVYGGRLLSEPATARVAPHEADVLLDARTNRLSFGRHTWSGRVTNRRTGRVLRLELLDSPPLVPLGCRRIARQTRCTRAGDVAWFDRDFGERTPSGLGVEVVLDRAGCVVRTARSRGTALTGRQTSLQATGRDTRALLRVRARGCLTRSVRLSTVDGRRVPLGPWTFAVNGRQRLASAGRVVVPTGTGPFYDRNPRTLVGTTGTGQVKLATIDGRRSTSVGTTMAETAAVVRALGLRDAVNLDGGGSTAMAVHGELVSQPSGAAERPVSDALVYVDSPF